METDAEKNLTFEELGDLRRKSEIISKFLHEQLAMIVETIRPVLAPERVLGKYVGGKPIAIANKMLVQLKEKYGEVCRTPFLLPREFDDDWLRDMEDRIELYPWKYTHEIKSGETIKKIAMTSPVCWVLNYRSGYTLGQLLQVLAGQGERRTEYIRKFVLNALVMDLVFAHYKGIELLFGDLRYTMEPKLIPALGSLPILSITSRLSAFRPKDDLILAATGFSGVPAFHELVDMAVFQNLSDPLKDHVEKLVSSAP